MIEVGDGGKQYKLVLLTDDGFDSLDCPAGLAPDGDDWQTIRLPLMVFHASFRWCDALALYSTRIRLVGLMFAPAGK